MASSSSTACSSGSNGVDPPPPKKTKFRLNEKLYEEMMESGHLLDLILIADNRKVYAHRCVVTAASDVIKDKLLNQFGNYGKGLMELPVGTSVQAAKIFAKVMYFGEMDKNTAKDIKSFLEAMSLCDKYLVDELLDTCISSVVDEITAENCLEICEGSFNLTKCKRFQDAAFSCVIRNFAKIIEISCTSMSYQMWNKILTHEGPEAVEIPEVDLFRKLLRFPLMTKTTIAQVIEPSGILSAVNLNAIFCYIIGGGDFGSRIPNFTTHFRKSKIAKDSNELELMLESAKPGDFIQLLSRKYEGFFNIPDKVTLKGAGPTTLITPGKPPPHRKVIDEAVFSYSNDVKISDLKIVCPSQPVSRTGLSIEGSRNTISNISLKNCSANFNGNYNVVENINCNGGEHGVLFEEGKNNSLSKGLFRNLEIGISMSDDCCGNVLKSVEFENVLHGIHLEANDNTLQDVRYEFNMNTVGNNKKQVAVIISGNRNQVKRIKCQNLEMVKNRKDKFSLEFRSLEPLSPSNNIVAGCCSGQVVLTGQDNSLGEVDAADLIIVSGKGHKLNKCSAQRCVNNNSTNVKLVDCNFSL